MRADLHMHSVFSDGVLTPAELADRVKAAGVSLFAVTDHDNMEAYPEAAAAARERGLKLVRGWEVSSYEGDGKVHLLGYGCRMGAPYRGYLRRRMEENEARMRLLVRRANEFYGTDVTLDEVSAMRYSDSIPFHTMHIVRLLSKRLNKPSGSVFRNAFAFGKSAYIRPWGIRPEEAVDLIHRDGGIAVLAHPGRIGLLTPEEYAVLLKGGRRGEEMNRENLSRRAALVDRLTAYGIDGLECVYSKHTPLQRYQYKQYALSRGLLVTGGSDFHDEGSPKIGFPSFEAGELADRLLSLDGSIS